MHTITLTPPAATEAVTTIHIASGAWKEIQALTKGKRTVVLYDSAIKDIAQPVIESLDNPLCIDVPSGDASKSLQSAEKIVEALLDAGCDKKTIMICIGGGMLTDLGGFVASIFMRGITCILMPTTLLGMIDASIGGKTAVNTADRKNMIGTITHPQAVIIDLELLDSLPKKQLCEGLAEVIKIAAMLDLPFFEWLEENLDAVLAVHPEAMEECVLRAVQAKVDVIEQDAHDRDVRLLLNFGHTVGHAIEAYSRYRLSHGEAISIGMVAEMKLAGKEYQHVEALLKKAGLPCVIPKDYSREELWKAMLTDKKNEGGIVKTAIPGNLGEGIITILTKESFLTFVS